ncbi:MAG: LPS export ABC transporter periplasmic protein LptC [bacterium]|nr:LPS export ABC transporter periplasmic protein LptC [bacterium]
MLVSRGLRSRLYLLLIFCIFLFACKGTEIVETESGKEKKESLADEVRTFRLKGIKQGKESWELEGHTAIIATDKSNEILIDKPFMRFFYDDGTVKATVQAQKAKVNSRTKNMQASENVIIISHQDESTLYTDEIFYNNKSEKFYSQARIRIERDDSITTGIGFDSPIDLSEINIHKDVEIKALGQVKE